MGLRRRSDAHAMRSAEHLVPGHVTRGSAHADLTASPALRSGLRKCQAARIAANSGNGRHVEAIASGFHGCVCCLSRGMRIKRYRAAIRFQFIGRYSANARTSNADARPERCHHRHGHRYQQHSDRGSHRHVLVRACIHRQQRELPPYRAGGRHLRRHLLGYRPSVPDTVRHGEQRKRGSERDPLLNAQVTALRPQPPSPCAFDAAARPLLYWSVAAANQPDSARLCLRRG